ncbi:ABC transporter substrate-binding protein [Zobellella endophytica]|uniref:ABC transporter substrate-binding protein n=1 Tax=Zobellella endophytica TaxID=2116700 RepID=A0A2P7R8C8_9GAMM|nr:transporter substrate-binding domain-containing protein [Zobellella endophytica]PSJ46484.1 ABC transporter substrate-binding protein [Zobellella endophytica]
MRNAVLPLLACYWLVSAFPALADRLVVATEGAYPPFSYIDEQGRLTGFDVDIALALCRAMAAECELVTERWDRLLDGLEQGRFDMVVASMARTEARARRADFSDHYYRTHSVFVGAAGNLTHATPEHLAGLRIATGTGTIQAAFLQRHYGASELLLSESQEQALDWLRTGKADLVLSDTINLLGFLQSREGEHFDYVGEPLADDLLKAEARIAVAKGNPALLERINQAIVTIRLNGSYDHINRQYIPFSVY